MRSLKSCPDGSGTQYEEWVSMSYSTFGRHLDWEPMSYMSFPFPVSICENGFIVDRPEEDWTEAWIAERTDLISDPDYQALLGKHTSHFIHARLLELEGAPLDEISWRYLNASWEAHQCGMDTYEAYVREYLRVSQAEYASMSPDAESFMLYAVLQVNMARRIGEFELARQRYDAFVAEHGERIAGRWMLAFSLLDQAITNRSSQQIAIQEPDD